MLLSAKKEAGFTLIEIMLTTMVVTIGAMVLIQGLSTNTAADVDTENRVIALNLVTEKLEELKSLNFTDLQLSPGTQTENQVTLGFASNDERNWTRDWVVTNYQGSSINELKSVRVTVNWSYKDQAVRLSVEATTLIVNMVWAGS